MLLVWLAVSAGVQSVNSEEKEKDKDKGRPELGAVTWGRDMDAALAASEKSGKPVFALFQEVPG